MGCLMAGLLSSVLLCSCGNREHAKGKIDMENMIIRISEIEVDTSYLDEYNAILKEEASASVRLEPGVISIYPMVQKENPAQIRILEIYASREAYQSHLETPHFKHYKSGTLHMVKSLRLVDMEAMDPETMDQIFRKINKE